MYFFQQIPCKTIRLNQNTVHRIFLGYLYIFLHRNQIKRSSPGKRCRLVNDLHDQQQAEWLDDDSTKSYNDLAAGDHLQH